MSDHHHIYLNLGSNLQPQTHLPKAIQLLQTYGNVKRVSSAWESHALGTQGPDFINISLEFLTPIEPKKLKYNILRPIEQTLGRVRGEDKNAPRTVDIDIIMADNKPMDLQRWKHPFVVIPTAELIPDLAYPLTDESLAKVAKRMQTSTWIVKRPDFFQDSNNAPE